MITIDVLGTPGAKGSPHTRFHNGRVIVHESKKVKTWESLVRERALEAVAGNPVITFSDKPLSVGIVFWLVRPAGHYGTGKKAGQLKPNAPARPHKKPDIDKLVRATLDPLIGSIFDDDSRIVELGVAKVYAAPGQEGARITVAEWTAQTGRLERWATQ